MQQCIKILLLLVLNETQVIQRPTTARPTTFHGIMQNQRLLVQF
jgi:hypothetical protein